MAQEPKDDPLPKGAMVRLGSDRPVFRFTPQLVLFPPDYAVAVVSDGRGGLMKFGVADGRPIEKAPAKPLAPAGGSPLVMSGDGKRWVAVPTGILTVRDTGTGKAVRALRLPMGFSTFSSPSASPVSLSHDGKVLAQGCMAQGKERRGELKVWDVEKGEVIFETATAQSGPPIPVLSADGKLVATRSGQPGFGPAGAADSTRVLQVWDVAAGKELFQTPFTPGRYTSSTALVFAPDNSTIAGSAGDGAIDVWDVKEGKVKFTVLGRTGQGKRLAFSPDGKVLAAVASDGALQRWSVADGKPMGTTEPPDSLPLVEPQGLAYAGNDRVVAWGTAGQAPVAWEALSGKILSPLPEHTAAVRSIGFAAGGKEIVTAGNDGKIVRWDAATGKPLGVVTLRPSRGPNAHIRSFINLSPDGTRAISSVSPPAVFDLATGLEEFSLPRGPIGVGTTTFTTSVTSDVTKAVTFSTTYDVKKPQMCAVWDLTARRKIAEVELTGLTGQLPRFPQGAVSPSGNRLVTIGYRATAVGGQDALVVMGWDLKTGKKLGEVEDVTSPGGAYVTAASEAYAIVSTVNGRIRAFDYETGKGGDEIEPAAAGGVVVSGGVVFSPDGKRFAVGVPTDDPGVFGVRVYDWPSGRALHTFTGHAGPVNTVAFSPDGKTLASGSQDMTVFLWDMSLVKGE